MAPRSENLPDEAVEAAYDAAQHLMITTAEIELILTAAAPFLMAQAWDEGHCTYVEREPSDCRCGAWNEGECGCGLYGTGKIIVFHWGCTECPRGSNEPTTRHQSYVAANNHSYDTGHYTIYGSEA